LRVAIIVGLPRKTPQPAVSIEGIHLAAGRKSIKTVVEPIRERYRGELSQEAGLRV